MEAPKLAEPTVVPRVLSVKEVVELIGVSRAKVTELVRENRIGHFRVGDRILFTEQDIADFIAAAHRPPVNSG